MSVDEALEFFAKVPKLKAKLQTLSDVGMRNDKTTTEVAVLFLVKFRLEIPLKICPALNVPHGMTFRKIND